MLQLSLETLIIRTFSFAINILSFIPYILLIIVYCLRIKKKSSSMIINFQLCVFCMILNSNYLIPINIDNYLCKIQGALYVSGFISLSFIFFIYTFFTFMNTIYPEKIEKHSLILNLIFTILLWIIFFSIGLVLFFLGEFQFNDIIDSCRLLRQHKFFYLFVFIFDGIVILNSILNIIVVVYLCLHSSKDKENSTKKYIKKIRMIIISDFICYFLFLFNWNILLVNLKSREIIIISTMLLFLSWPFMLCVHAYNETVREEIKVILCCKKNNDFVETDIDGVDFQKIDDEAYDIN